MARTGTIAHLWEYPRLTIGIFGMDASSPEALVAFEAEGILAQMEDALRREDGLLHVRSFREGSAGVLLQYWRSHDDLARFARRAPHADWWRWRREHADLGLAFWHEIYQCRTAEALYEAGAPIAGPAAFATTSEIVTGSGHSRERQRRFADAARSAPAPA